MYCSEEHRRLHSVASHSVTCGHVPPSSIPSLIDDTPPPVPLKFPLMASHILAATLIQQLTRASSAPPPSSPPSPPSSSSSPPPLWSDLGRLCYAELDPLALGDDYESLIAHLHSHLHRHPSLSSTSLTLPQLRALLPPALHLRTLALLHLNAHSVHPTPLPLPSSPIATALFPYAASFNHDCEPNVQLDYPLQEGEGGGKRVGVWRALREVDEGEELCNAYTDVARPVEERRAYLQWAYGFVCRCQRCTREAEESS